MIDAYILLQNLKKNKNVLFPGRKTAARIRPAEERAAEEAGERNLRRHRAFEVRDGRKRKEARSARTVRFSVFV